MPKDTAAVRARSTGRRTFQESSSSKGPAFTPRARKESPTSIARDLGECVYFIRTKDDLVKIGHTTNLAKRKGGFGVSWNALLAVLPGTYEDEQVLHAQFVEHLERGREWYRPAPAILARINEIRARFGIPAVEPW